MNQQLTKVVIKKGDSLDKLILRRFPNREMETNVPRQDKKSNLETAPDGENTDLLDPISPSHIHLGIGLHLIGIVSKTIRVWSE